MPCTCGICQSDRRPADDPQRTLAVRLADAEAIADRLTQDAGKMVELAHSIGDDPANPVQRRSFDRLIRWAGVSREASARLRDLVAEVTALCRELH